MKNKKKSKEKPVLNTRKKNKKLIGNYDLTISGFFSYNNTLLSLTRPNGEAIEQISGGRLFKGSRKSTVYAAEKAIKGMIDSVKEYGKKVDTLKLNGIGAGRNVVIREILKAFGDNIKEIVEATPVAFNGTRPRKAPRK